MADPITSKVQWPNYSATNPKPKSDANLGKDDFLKILIAQLKNQDPTQPLQDREFIAQMAQFTSVEQLTNMANEMKMLRQSMGFATGLIGKSVEWEQINAVTNLPERLTGIVDSIRFKDGLQFADIGGNSVNLDRILQVWQAAAPESKPDGGGEAEEGADQP